MGFGQCSFGIEGLLALFTIPSVSAAPTVWSGVVLASVAGAGALFALVMAYRKQRVAEMAEECDWQRMLHEQQKMVHEQQRAADDRERVFNERFATASAQLGHDQPAVRLAGAYAMARLADDWAHGR